MAINVRAVDSTKEASYTDAEWRDLQSVNAAGSSSTAVYSGVRPNGSGSLSLNVAANGTPNNTVIVNTGCGKFVSGTGTYEVNNTSQVTLTVPAADATLLRRDSVIVDPTAALAANRIAYVAGTPGAGSYPVVSAPQYKLADVDCRSVAVAGGTVIRTADIFDQRAFYAAPGGRMLSKSTARPATPHAGLEIYESDTGLLLTSDGSTWLDSNKQRMVTSSTRPASPHNGQVIFETDTGLQRVYRSDQSKWQTVGGDLPAAKVKITADKGTSHNVLTLLSWDGVDYDDPGGANAIWAAGNPSRLRAPVAGIYDVHIFLQWQTNSTGIRSLVWRKNAAGSGGGGTFLGEDNSMPNTSADPSRRQYSRRLALAANDYIEFFVYQFSGGALSVWSGAENTGAEIIFMRDL